MEDCFNDRLHYKSHQSVIHTPNKTMQPAATWTPKNVVVIL